MDSKPKIIMMRFKGPSIIGHLIEQCKFSDSLRGLSIEETIKKQEEWEKKYWEVV